MALFRFDWELILVAEFSQHKSTPEICNHLLSKQLFLFACWLSKKGPWGGTSPPSSMLLAADSA